MNSVVFYCSKCNQIFVGKFYREKDHPRCPQCNKKTVSTDFSKEQWIELSKEERKKVMDSLTEKEASAEKRFNSVAKFVNKHIITVRNIRTLLVVAVMLSIISYLLYLSSTKWEISAVDDWLNLGMMLLEKFAICYILFHARMITQRMSYSRHLVAPIAILLICGVISLCAKVDSLKWYTENPFLYQGTTVQWVLFYVINLGPHILSMVSFFLVGLFAVLKKKKSIVLLVLIGVASMASVTSTISLIVRGAEVYLQHFGVEYVLQLILGGVAGIATWIGWIMILMPLRPVTVSSNEE